MRRYFWILLEIYLLFGNEWFYRCSLYIFFSITNFHIIRKRINYWHNLFSTKFKSPALEHNSKFSGRKLKNIRVSRVIRKSWEDLNYKSNTEAQSHHQKKNQTFLSFFCRVYSSQGKSHHISRYISCAEWNCHKLL